MINLLVPFLFPLYNHSGERKIKKFFLLICVAVLPLFADEKIKSDGNKIFDDKNNLGENTFVSPDGSKELVCHRQDESGDCLISLYDLRSKKLIAESKNQWWCRGVRWTDDYLVYTWATTGGGWRFEYRNYKNLSVEKLVTSYHPFEDPDENLLFDTNYMCLNSDIGIAAYNYSDGNTIKVFSFIDELYRNLWKSDEPKITSLEKSGKGIFAHISSIENFSKTGKGKYSFIMNYVFQVEDDEEPEYRSAVMEIEL